MLQPQVDKAEQDKQSAVIRAKGEVLGQLLMLRALTPSVPESVDVPSGNHAHNGALQAQSAKLIGEAIQSNPAFLTLRKIEVGHHASVRKA